MSLSTKEFAVKIKAKYPQYNEMPDDSLALLVIKKYPQYKEEVDLGTLEAKYIPTARSFGIDIDSHIDTSLSGASGGEFNFLGGVKDGLNATPSPVINPNPMPTVQGAPASINTDIQASAQGMNTEAIPGSRGNFLANRANGLALQNEGMPTQEQRDDEFRAGNQFQLRLAAAQKKWDDDYKAGRVEMVDRELPGMGDMGRPMTISVPKYPRPTENSFVAEEAGQPLEPGSVQRMMGEIGTTSENVLGPATGLLLGRKPGERRAITFNEKKLVLESKRMESELTAKEARGESLTEEEKVLKADLNPDIWDGIVAMAKQVYDDPKRFIELSAPSLAVGVLTAPAMDAGFAVVASRLKDAARVYKMARINKILKARRGEAIKGAVAGERVAPNFTNAADDVAKRYASQVGLENARKAVADALVAGTDSRGLATALQKVGIQSTKGQRRLLADVGREMLEEVGPVAFAQTMTDWGQGRGDLDAETIVTNVFSSLPLAMAGGLATGLGGAAVRSSVTGGVDKNFDYPTADRVAKKLYLNRPGNPTPERVVTPNYARGVSETLNSPELQSTSERIANTLDRPEMARHYEKLVPSIAGVSADSRVQGAGENAFVRGMKEEKGAFSIGTTAYGGGEGAGVHEAIHGIESYIRSNESHADVHEAIQDWKDQAYNDLRDNKPELYASLNKMVRNEREAKEELFTQAMTRALGLEDNNWGVEMEPALTKRFAQYLGKDGVKQEPNPMAGNEYKPSQEEMNDVPFSILKDGKKSTESQSPLAYETNSEGKPVHSTAEGRKNFAKWFKGSKVVDAEGRPLVVYHGTTANFNSFDRGKSNPESNFGSGFYFTNTSGDVKSNYAGIGPDLKNKIQREAERIASETDREYNDPEVIKEAKEKFVQNKGKTLKTYLKFENPVIVGDDPYGANRQTIFDLEIDDDGNESGSFVDLVNSIRNVSDEFSGVDADQLISDLSEYAMDGITAKDLVEKAKSSEGLLYAEDENGNLVSSEVIRRIFENMGFDGIIDYSVNRKFGSQRKDGVKMKGMNEGTTHYIAFSPTQIKSATGNRGSFSEDNADIRYSLKRNDADITTNSEGKPVHSTEEGRKNFAKWFKGSKVVDSEGRPLVVYHGSPDVRGILKDGFKAGFRGRVHFAALDYSTANSYADDTRAFDYQNAEPQTIPIYLKIKNPLIVDAEGRNWKETELYVNKAIEGGNDGLIIKNSVDYYNNDKGSRPTDVFAWFDPNQAKSAIKEQLNSRIDKIPLFGAVENSGKFSKQNDKIQFSIYPKNEKQKAQASIIRMVYAGLRKNGLALPNNISYHDISQKWGAMPKNLDDEGKKAYRKKWDSALESFREGLQEDEYTAMNAGISKNDIDNENVQEIIWKLSDWANSMSEKPKKGLPKGFDEETERMMRGASPEAIAEYEAAKKLAMEKPQGKRSKRTAEEQAIIDRYTPPKGQSVEEFNTASDFKPSTDPTASKRDAFAGAVSSGETDETKREVAIRKIYDYLNPVKKVQERVTGTTEGEGGATHEAMLQASRAQAKVGKVKRTFLDPVMKLIKGAKLSIEEVDQFLYARHAFERNEKMAKRRPDQFSDPEKNGGSGMSNATARAILKRFELDSPEKFSALNRIGTIMDRMNAWRLEYGLSEGIISPEEKEAYEGSYKHYIPLRGKVDPTTEKIDSRPGVGRGMQARKDNKYAFGRKSLAKDVLAQAFTRTMEIISNAEKNTVGLAVAKMIRENPDPEYWTIDKTPMKFVLDKQTGEAKQAPDMKMNAPNEYSFFENGQKHTIRFQTPEGLRFVKALNGMSEVSGNTVLKVLSKIHRFIAGTITSFSPEFTFSNAARDALTASITSSVRDGGKVAKKTLFNAPKAAVSIMGKEFGKRNMGDWGRYYERFQKAGGKTAFLVMQNFEDFADNMKGDLKNSERSVVNPKKVFNTLVNTIERVNTGVENGTRLAYFRALVDGGMSDESAALKAKELTVNFERHGEEKWMNQLWMFMNAALQGSSNVGRLFINKKTRPRAIAAASALVSLGAMNALMNKELGGEDEESGEDYWDRVKSWERDRNLVFLNPISKEGGGIKIPLPYELSFFIRLGQEMVDLGYGKNPADASLSIMNAAISSVSPLGSPFDAEDGLRVKNPIGLVTPTAFQAFADLERNRDFSGKPIYKEDSPIGVKKPNSQSYFHGVNPYLRDVASAVNVATGGNEYVSGSVDINPEWIEHLINSYTGGIGSITQKTVGLGKTVASGEKVELRQIPFVRKFFRNDNANDRKDFDKIFTLGSQHSENFESLMKAGEEEKANDYENKNYLLITTARVMADKGKGIDWNSVEQKDEMTSLYKRSKNRFKRAEEIQEKLSSSESEDQRQKYRDQIDSLISSAWDGFMDSVE